MSNLYEGLPPDDDKLFASREPSRVYIGLERCIESCMWRMMNFCFFVFSGGRPAQSRIEKLKIEGSCAHPSIPTFRCTL